jgi:hypothetical protein
MAATSPGPAVRSTTARPSASWQSPFTVMSARYA